MNDTIVIYRQPERVWPDGERSRVDFVAVVLHRTPFEPVQPNRAPDAKQDRTVYVGNRTRDEAIQEIEERELLLAVPLAEKLCGFKHEDQCCTLRVDHPGPHDFDDL